jgi:hypothetical protein
MLFLNYSEPDSHDSARFSQPGFLPSLGMSLHGRWTPSDRYRSLLLARLSEWPEPAAQGGTGEYRSCVLSITAARDLGCEER